MIRLWLIFTFLAVSSQLSCQEIKFTEDGTISYKGEQQFDSLKWVIYSDRNNPVSRMRDRSKNAPEDYTYPPQHPGRQIWFPVVDLHLQPGFTMVATFDNVEQGDSACFNGNFVKMCGPLKPKLSYRKNIEHWENQLFVKSETATLKDVSFELPMTEKRDFRLNPLSSWWQGGVETWGKHVGNEWKLLTSKKINIGSYDEPSLSQEAGLTKELVRRRLSLASEYLVNSRNLNPLSPTYGGLYLFYDLEWDTYRRSDWIWSYGPAIQVLVEASKIRGLSPNYSSEQFMAVARQVAEASLRYQQENVDHPAYGLVMCRYDPRTASPHGAEGYFSPADSYFLAGWGWMPYYNATGDKRFLKATKLMTRGIDRILGTDTLLPDGKHPLIEQDYLMKEGKWKNWTMDESGFGMKGAEELYQVTKDPYHRYVGKRYITGLLDYLERPDGLWDRTWHRNDSLYANNGWPVGAPRGTPVLIETKYSTRGLGWAMIGLLASHRMMPEGNVYLEKAIKLADHLVEAQGEDGHWNFLFKGNEYKDEISEKGTALWSLLFYQLYSYTGNEEHLEVARKGLTWCINNQYISPNNSEAYGGIMGKNRESGVVYRRWSPMICSYTVAWFGLALLEELKLQSED